VTARPVAPDLRPGDLCAAGDRSDRVVRRVYWLECEGWVVEFQRRGRRLGPFPTFPAAEVALRWR
jgi:hypothetical protein